MSPPCSTLRWRDVLLTAAAPAIWGSTYIVTTELLPPGRPLTAALLRTLPAGVLLLLYARVVPQRRDWWRIAVLSALNIGFFQALLFVAAYRLPGGLAAVLGAVQPLLVMGLTWAVDGRAPRRITLAAAGAGVGGMALLLLSPQTVPDPIGITAALLGAISMATGMWLTRRWQVALPIGALTGWQLLLGGAMLMPAVRLWEAPLPADMSPLQWSAYAYLSLVGALLAYGLWFRGITRLPTVAVASLGLLSPLTAVVLGWALLAQSVSGMALCGLLAVLGSVWIVQRTT